MITWYYMPKSVYESLADSLKTDDKLFYIIENKVIYKGKTLFNERHMIYKISLPVNKSEDILYINSSDLSGFVWNAEWVQTINPVSPVLSSNPEYLATVNNVATILSVLKSTSNEKMTKIGEGYDGQILIADTTGNAAPSGKTIGSDTFGSNPSKNVLATEKGVVNYVTGRSLMKSDIVEADDMHKDPSEAFDDKIPSEKAIVASLRVVKLD